MAGSVQEACPGKFVFTELEDHTIREYLPFERTVHSLIQRPRLPSRASRMGKVRRYCFEATALFLIYARRRLEKNFTPKLVKELQ